MATLTEFLAALAERDDVVHVGPAVPPQRGVQFYFDAQGNLLQAEVDADDNLRKRAGLATLDVTLD